MTSKSTARRLQRGTDADRVLACVLDPIFEGATAREIASELGLSVAYVEEQVAAIADERALLSLLSRAADVRERLLAYPVSCQPDTSNVVAMLGEALDNLEKRHALMLTRLAGRLATAPVGASLPKTPVPTTERRLEAVQSGNRITGGARPPEQSRGASPTRNGDDGRSQDGRGSRVTGLGAHR